MGYESSVPLPSGSIEDRQLAIWSPLIGISIVGGNGVRCRPD